MSSCFNCLFVCCNKRNIQCEVKVKSVVLVNKTVHLVSEMGFKDPGGRQKIPRVGKPTEQQEEAL